MNYQKFDIAIIGSSYAGMTCALALAQISPQISIALIEKEQIFENARVEDGRAYAISSSSLKLFDEFSILSELEKISGKISDIKITDYKSPFVLDFIGAEFDKKNQQFGLIIENHFIFEALKKRISNQKNIQIFCPNFYQEIESSLSPTIKLDNGLTIQSKLIIACDGRFSKLRQLYKIPTTIKNYHQTAIVFKIHHQISHNQVAYERFLPSGPLAILPLQDLNQSSIVWITNDSTASTLLDLDDENFLQQLHKKMENCLGKCEIISRKFSYPLTMVLANKFHHQKLLLVGDSACGVHPIAGQGFNLAIANIIILRNLISKYIMSGLDFSSDELIKNYNSKARANSKKMVIATDILNSIFENSNFAVSGIRNLGLGIINSLPSIKKFFIKNAGGIE
ncbi:MAG: hypothetical protein EBT63_04520 [Proteobacteria bacterium]|jgi:2-octaprenyl-6-methoxyphenol hydroxylase|nr:hypothetical protein [Pseudomonadota bacterium]NCA28070.1 hypothetical protein [Pseudomonadota bacterium]